MATIASRECTGTKQDWTGTAFDCRENLLIPHGQHSPHGQRAHSSFALVAECSKCTCPRLACPVEERPHVSNDQPSRDADRSPPLQRRHERAARPVRQAALGILPRAAVPTPTHPAAAPSQAPPPHSQPNRRTTRGACPARPTSAPYPPPPPSAATSGVTTGAGFLRRNLVGVCTAYGTPALRALPCTARGDSGDRGLSTG